jgi:hypothetical protein
MGTRKVWVHDRFALPSKFNMIQDGRIHKTPKPTFERQGHSECVYIRYIKHTNGHVQELRTRVRSSHNSMKRHK